MCLQALPCPSRCPTWQLTSLGSFFLYAFGFVLQNQENTNINSYLLPLLIQKVANYMHCSDPCLFFSRDTVEHFPHLYWEHSLLSVSAVKWSIPGKHQIDPRRCWQGPGEERQGREDSQESIRHVISSWLLWVTEAYISSESSGSQCRTHTSVLSCLRDWGAGVFIHQVLSTIVGRLLQGYQFPGTLACCTGGKGVAPGQEKVFRPQNEVLAVGIQACQRRRGKKRVWTGLRQHLL